jgi:hypothetical protein
MLLRVLRFASAASLVALLSLPVLSRNLLAQQTDVRQYSIYNGFTYFETPALNLAEHGYHLQVGRNMKTWVAIGFDYSIVSGHNSLTPDVLKPALRTQLEQEIEFLISVGLLPPGYQLVVPTDAFSQTFALGPQFEFRHYKPVTLFVRPSLGAIRQKVTPHPTDPFATQVVETLVPSGKKPTGRRFTALAEGSTGMQHATLRFVCRAISFIGTSSTTCWQTGAGRCAFRLDRLSALEGTSRPATDLNWLPTGRSARAQSTSRCLQAAADD